jgi:hypothetical protein
VNVTGVESAAVVGPGVHPWPPDPSLLTTAQILREINNLKELLEARDGGVALQVQRQFESVALQFELVERQRVEQKQDTKIAVDAALQAQKEAVREQTTASERAIAKSETATAKVIDQQTLANAAAINGVLASLSDVKERVGKIEFTKVGSSEQDSLHRARSQDVGQWIAWAAGGFMSIVSTVVVIITVFHR